MLFYFILDIHFHKIVKKPKRIIILVPSIIKVLGFRKRQARTRRKVGNGKKYRTCKEIWE